MKRIISGKVIMGKKRGRAIGFPTANILLDKELESGVYEGKVFINNKEYRTGVFVSPDEKMLEVHLVGFSGDLCGKEIEIEVGNRIRDVKKFGSDEELKEQIADDLRVINNS